MPNVQFVQSPAVALYSPLSASATSMILAPAPVDLDGNLLTMSSFGTVGYCTVDPKVSGYEEIIGFTGITNNGNNTATLTGLMRDMQSQYPYQANASGTGNAHGSSATVVFSDNPQMYAALAAKNNNENITGAWTFNTAPVALSATIATTTSVGNLRISVAPATNMGNPTVTIASPAVFSLTAHGLTVNDSVTLATTGSLPTGLAPATTYYVISTGLTSNAFELSATPGGTAITTTGSQSGVITLTRTTPIAVGNDDTRLPSANATLFLNTVTGMVAMFGGQAAPTGFLLCNGAAYNTSVYPALALVLNGYWGLGTQLVFTASGNTITADAHGYSNGTQVFVQNSGGGLPSGLTPNTPYYVIAATTNTFQLSLSLGGSAVTLSSAGTGTNSVSQQFCVPDLRSSVPVGAGTRSFSRGYDSTIQTETDSSLGQVITAAVTTISGANDSTMVISTAANHGLTTGDPIQFTGSLPSGLSTGTLYYAIVTGAQTFTLASTYKNAVTYGINDVTFSSTTTGGSVCPAGYFNAPFNNPGWIQRGTQIVLSTSNTAPTGLSAGTYYAVVFSRYPTRIYLASTQANAYLFTPVVITGQGTGIQTLVASLSARTDGDSGGEEVHALSIEEIPNHYHNITIANNSTGNVILKNSSASGEVASGTTGTGSDNAHNNMPPFSVILYIIKT
jgi:hypothetical protein